MCHLPDTATDSVGHTLCMVACNYATTSAHTRFEVVRARSQYGNTVAFGTYSPCFLVNSDTRHTGGSHTHRYNVEHCLNGVRGKQ